MAPPERPAPAPAAPGAPPLVAFDVTDLIDYVRGARTPTGIQRVQLSVVARAAAEPPAGAEVALTAFAPATGRWLALDRDAFLRMAGLAAAGAAEDDPAWLAAVEALAPEDLADKAPDAPFRPGFSLVNMGNAWGVQDYFRGLRRLRRRMPLRFVPFVHDCIPLVAPEHCLELTVRLYAAWFGQIVSGADAVLANSRHTAGDFARLAAALLPPGAPPPPPVTVVPLDADMASAVPARVALRAAEGLRGGPRPDEPFVLFVSTLESRKDHLLVFSAWLALIRKLGAERVPRLVCVGKPGWHAEAALALLENSPPLRRKVSILTEVSDHALSGLYRRCLFTVYNSFYEGWGLPVTESLSHGKVPVVPAHTALRESGGPGAVFFAPRSEPDLVEKLEGLILDPQRRAEQEAKIAAAPLRPWEAVRDQVLEAVLSLPPAERRGPGPERVRLASGQVLSLASPATLGAAAAPSAAAALAERVRDDFGWFSAERWGVWSRQGFAALTLPLPAELARPAAAPSGEATPEGGDPAELRLYLALRAPGRAPLRLRLRATPLSAEGAPLDGDGPWREAWLATPGEETVCALPVRLPPGADALELMLGCGEGGPLDPVVPGDPRMAGIGLRALMLCREDDAAARLSLLEHAETWARGGG